MNNFCSSKMWRNIFETNLIHRNILGLIFEKYSIFAQQPSKQKKIYVHVCGLVLLKRDRQKYVDQLAKFPNKAKPYILWSRDWIQDCLCIITHSRHRQIFGHLFEKYSVFAQQLSKQKRISVYVCGFVLLKRDRQKYIDKVV